MNNNYFACALLVASISAQANEMDDLAIQESKVSELAGCIVGLSVQDKFYGENGSEGVRLSISEAQALVNEVIGGAKLSGLVEAKYKESVDIARQSLQSRVDVILAMDQDAEVMMKSLVDSTLPYYEKCLPYLTPVKLKGGGTALVRD